MTITEIEQGIEVDLEQEAEAFAPLEMIALRCRIAADVEEASR